MRFVVITGPSGAGKTLALHSFEDAGYYSVDNVPPALLPSLSEFCARESKKRAAVVVDTRSGAAFDRLPDVMAELRSSGLEIELLFLDAGDEVLVQRFKETRRPHPLLGASNGEAAQAGIVEAIEAERSLLEAARGVADSVIDTSALNPWSLREVIHDAYALNARPGLLVTVISFGFKHGLPIDADLVLDVRFLKNPHYVPELKGLDGRDRPVADFIHADPLALKFLKHVETLVGFALPQYVREGKAYLNIGIGCTGGQHRSVTLAEDLSTWLREQGYHVATRHRDISSGHPPEVPLSGGGVPSKKRLPQKPGGRAR
ncbi:MAG TPA: RNase adapter RapZ [Chthonomonadales bacterium]|nr:RNase adapter RapZ [Chthonomonadales bacterium]